MKYAKEVLDLLGTYPERDFRMMEIVNYVVGKGQVRSEREASRKAIARVLQAMEAGGSLVLTPSLHERGGYATYRLKTQHTAPGVAVASSDRDILGDFAPADLTRLRAWAASEGLSDPYKAYMKQRTRAASRGIEFELTLSEWWAFWDGHYRERGSRPMDLCMARCGDVGPYAVGNIYLASNQQNLRDYQRSGKKSHDLAESKAGRKAELLRLIAEAENRPPPQYSFEQVTAMLRIGVPFELRRPG